MADAPLSMTIDAAVKESYETAKEHGFWDGVEQDNVPSKLMLMVSELSEALEIHRDPEVDLMVKVPADLLAHLISYAEDAGAKETAKQAEELLTKHRIKPKGFDIELADALIRIFDLAGRKNIDLDAALRRKLEYNKTRPFRHGRRV